MSAFDNFKADILQEIGPLATSTFKDFANEAQQDVTAFLQQSAAKLERWTGMLARGDLTKPEFTVLVESQKGLLTLHALTQEGIALATLQRFRDKVIDIVISAAFKAFL